MYKLLFIFVEGDHDKLFFKKIRDYLYCHEYKYDIKIFKYQEKKDKKVNNLIKKCKSKENYEYFFVADLDSKYFKCFTSKKDKMIKKYDALDKDKIIIVKEEIESWYFSGNKSDDFRENELDFECSKEEFDELITSKFDSKIRLFK
ncbi:MAG: conserved hypothetical protein [Methanobrevibacter sp. CfCl-M3]